MATLFGRYEYAGELGHGASGRVFAVRDLGANREPRAIKVVAADAGRLVWEFQRLCQVSHPRVARVREMVRLEERAPTPFALERGSLLLVQDFVEGAPLSAASGDRLPLVARVGIAITEGLVALHEASLVHGDVKPDNVICGPNGENATLIDLGFARPPEVGTPRGTPAYMAPEMFAGVCTPAADVFALGALLYDVLRGDAIDSASSGRGLFRARDLSLIEDADFRRVLTQLLAPDRAQRPADASAALALLLPAFTSKGLPVEALRYASLRVTRTPREQAERVRTLPLVGHEAALASLVEAIAQPGLVAVRGPRGAGRSRLVREALRTLQASAKQPTWVSSLSALALLRDVHAILWLERAREEDLPEITRAATAATLSLRSLCVVLEGDVPAPRVVELGALSEPAFAALLVQLAPRSVLGAARAATHGLAGRLCELAAQLLLAERDLSDPRVWQALEGPGEAALVRAQPLAQALAWFGADLTPELAARVWGAEAAQAAYDELRVKGLLHEDDGALVLDLGLARTLRAQSDRAALAPLLQQVPATTGFALLLTGGDATRAFLARARALRAEGRVDAACTLLADAGQEELALFHADSERARGRYAEALAVLGERGPLLRAELLRLVERIPEARALLESLRGDRTNGARATALLARLAFDGGDFTLASSEARAAQGADREASVRALEVEVLVCLARGALAEAPVDALVQAASGGGQAPSFLARAPARAASLRSQVLARRGDRLRAVGDARAAVEQARALGEAHEAATYALNLGLLELERGELGRALETLRDAAQRLARVARVRELARVLFNFAGLALLVGDFTRAEVVLDRAGDDP
ncbi:MAG TPA: protein kinase, partial [Polyangiales bacterium]|nr:protein kinase [Polyangiales bacterium]